LFLQQYGVLSAGFRQADDNVFIWSGGEVLAHEICFDRQLAVAAVDEHGQLNALGPAKVIERIHRRARGSAAEKNVVDQNHRFACHVKRDNRWMHVGCQSLVQVVAVHANVQLAYEDGLAPNGSQEAAQPFCQNDPSALNPHKHDFLRALIPFDDFVRDTGKRPLNSSRVKNG